jgi:hypothetical protein
MNALYFAIRNDMLVGTTVEALRFKSDVWPYFFLHLVEVS